MRGWTTALALGLATLWAASCSDTDPAGCPDGMEGCACYGNGTCDDGLQCRSELCVEASGATDDAGAATARDAEADAATTNDADSDAATARDAGSDAATANDAGSDATTANDAGNDAATANDAGNDAATASDAATDGGAGNGDGGGVGPCSEVEPQGYCAANEVCECGRCQPALPERGCGLDSGYPGDDACLPPPDPALGFQIHIGPSDYTDSGAVAPFLLMAGQDRSDCYSFVTPNGDDASSWGTHLSVRPGALRTAFQLYASANSAGSGFVVCRGTPDWLGTLASGVGGETPPRTRAPENDGLQTQIDANTAAQMDHTGFNFTNDPILREAWLNVYTADPLDAVAVTTPLSAFGGVTWMITPGTDQVYPYACDFDGPGRLLRLFTLMHSHNERQTVWIRRAGTGARIKILEQRDWSTQRSYFFDSCTENPPLSASGSGAVSGILDVAAGDSLEWECHVVNDSGYNLYFTNSASTGEMCALFGDTLGGTRCL